MTSAVASLAGTGVSGPATIHANLTAPGLYAHALQRGEHLEDRLLGEHPARRHLLPGDRLDPDERQAVGVALLAAGLAYLLGLAYVAACSLARASVNAPRSHSRSVHGGAGDTAR